MVIHDFHGIGISIRPCKADAKLVVDANAVLLLPVAGEGLQMRTRQPRQILQGLRAARPYPAAAIRAPVREQALYKMRRTSGS